MKKFILLMLVNTGLCVTLYAQTNTFPANGNVGIGMLNNNYKLTVDGTSKFTGNLNAPRGYFKDVAFTNPQNPFGLDFLLRAINPNTLELRAVVNENNFAFVFSIDKNSQMINFYKPIISPDAINDNELVNLGQLKTKIGNYVGINGSQEVHGSKYFMDNVGIGTTTPAEKLSVNGKIRAHEIKVEATNWPDYVFEEGYDVGTLEALESYLKTHKHLPEMPSAKEVESNGVALGEMNKLLLKKIEELTLLLINQNKTFDKRLLEQQQEIENLKRKLN